MPYVYAPGLPWNPSHDYEQFDTCTYKGLMYTCMSGYGSDPGAKPNESMSIYDAYDPLTGTTVTDTDRTWALGDLVGYSDAFGYAVMTPSVRAGSVRRLQFKLRGIGGITFGVNEDHEFQDAFYLAAAFPGFRETSPLGIGTKGSAIYYEQKGGGQSYEWGVAKDNPDPYPDWITDNGNGNVVEHISDDITQGGFYHPQVSYVETDEPYVEMTQEAGVATVRARPNVSRPSGVNTFNKTLTYTLNCTSTDTSTSPPTVTNFTVSGSVSTGDPRDDWYDPTTSTPVVHSYPDTATVTTVFVLVASTSPTPRMDA